ncbi:MAG TPA: hypothetical protein VMP11_09680 [Verrucomicrobiae bacterium]|nr:hypothetical protein [Verrucomicrobiae bacterium]
MTFKLLLTLTLVWGVGLSGCARVARADETNAPVSTNAAQSYLSVTARTD